MNKCGKKNKINKTKLIESGIMGALVWGFFFFFYLIFLCVVGNHELGSLRVVPVSYMG